MNYLTQIFTLGLSMTVVTVIATMGLYSLVFDGQPAAVVVLGIAGSLNWYLWHTARRSPDFSLVPNIRRGPISTFLLIGIGFVAYLVAADDAERQRVRVFDPTIEAGALEGGVFYPQIYQEEQGWADIEAQQYVGDERMPVVETMPLKDAAKVLRVPAPDSVSETEALTPGASESTTTAEAISP